MTKIYRTTLSKQKLKQVSMKKYFSLLILLAFISGNAPAQNRSIDFEQGNFKALLAKAKKENKMIFIDCYTTWCGPCKWMAKNIFTNDSAADYYNQNFINAKIDMEKGEGIEIAKEYSVQNYPTMLYLNAEGEQMHRICGSSPTQEFIQNGKDALDPEKQMAGIKTQFNKGKTTAEIATDYFASLHNACLSANQEVTEYFNTVQPEEYKSEANWNIIRKYVNEYFTETFQVFEADRAEFSNLYGKETVDQKISEVYTSSLKTAIRNNDDAGFNSLCDKLRKSKTEDAEKTILRAQVSRSENKEDWKEYSKLASEYISGYAAEEADDLNNFAWTFYEHVDDPQMLARAEGWAKTACELVNNYANNDTYAAVLFKLNKKKEAEAAAKKAISIAANNGEDAKETEALLDKIKALQ
jgi:thiol-disulfide isomerase/thioredoxin